MKGNRASADTVALIHESYESYRHRFQELTRLAKRRFEERDWHATQREATDRLALYKDYLTAVRVQLAEHYGGTPPPAEWRSVKSRYAALVSGRLDEELARTYFNSVSRRFFGVVGVAPELEFTATELGTTPRPGPPITSVIERDAFDTELVRSLFRGCEWSAPWLDLDGDASRVADRVCRRLGGHGPVRVEMVSTPFYRNKGAYLVGRILHAGAVVPLVIALLHEERGLIADAVLTTSDDASIVFGFSWRYFRVDVEHPAALVEFLASIMPLKRVDELYTAIGFNRHGKAQLYRTLMLHLASSPEQFDFAEGDQGLVMSVFTFPSFNVVFKIIKDRFGQPKRTTRRAVMEKYHLVFLRDRVGRLADAQEFQYLDFPRACFSDALLEHLLREAAGSVRLEGERVVITHLYTERRVHPLNLYLREVSADAARDAIVDYGRAIKELAGSNIFTGDMLLKNFGVSRHGRVIFYDYDELVLLTECVFREIPQARHLDEEMSAEPWYYVGEHDVFPEEFASFLVPPGRLRDTFLDEHADLLTVRFWREMQERQRAGEILDVFPYRPEHRLTR